jgi:hypothetical protein
MPVFRKKPVEIEAVQWNGEVIVGGCPPWLAAVGEDLADAPVSIEEGRTAFVGDRVYHRHQGRHDPRQPGRLDHQGHRRRALSLQAGDLRRDLRAGD